VRSVPKASSPAVRARLQRQKIRDTAPELALRRELHSRGLRYRVDVPLLGARRGRADIMFSRAKLVVMVDGCFWHRCPEHGLSPRANRDWWQQKLDRNVERDRFTDAELASLGWTVFRIWEHESPKTAADRIEAAVRQVKLSSELPMAVPAQVPWPRWLQRT
jgi:DNA mismatch endonuclease (patch repair protein)